MGLAPGHLAAAAALCCVLASGQALAAQEPAAPGRPAARPQWTVAEIVLEGAGDREAEIRQALLLRAGELFEAARLDRDVEFLWQRMRVRLERVLCEPLPGNRVRVLLRVAVVPTLRRVVFQGNEEFEWDRLQLETGLAGAQMIDQETIPRIVQSLEDFYRREGYAFVSIQPAVEEDLGQVRLSIEEGPLVRVGDVDFVGNTVFPESTMFGIGTDLSGEIQSGDGFLFFPGSKYSEEVVRQDLTELEKLYHEYGYLEAKASLEAREFYRGNSRVRLVFHIYEGPLYTVRSVRVRPAEGGAPLLVPEQRLLEEIGLRPGMAYDRARVAEDEGALRRFYGRRGHPAAVRGRGQVGAGFFQFCPPMGEPELTNVPGGNEVDVTYRIQEGRPMRIREVVVQGNVHTRDAVIRREISLEPGDLADTEEALRSWRRLLGLNYFADRESRAPYVQWWFTETERQDWVDLNFEVAEGQTGRLLFGGGLNTSTGPFLSVSLEKQNFDLSDTPSSLGSTFPELLDGRAFTGRGQTLRIQAAPGTQFSYYSVQFTEPDLFGDHLDRYSLNTSLFKTFYFLDTHEELRTGASVRLGRNFGRYFTIYAQPEAQRVELGNPRPGAPAILRETLGSNRLQAFTLGARYNTVEDPFSPVSGGRVGVSRRQAGEAFGGDWDFSQSQLDAAKYFTLWEDGKGRPWVLALDGTLQLAGETGALRGVPYTERYFLGGQATLRGFDFRGVGPRAHGFPLGGEAAWFGTTEIRFPLVSTRARGAVDEIEYIRGSLFLDYGSVGKDLGALGPTRAAAGVGVQMRIPFLPGLGLTLDFGWPVRSEPEDDARVFSFNLGFF